MYSLYLYFLTLTNDYKFLFLARLSMPLNIMSIDKRNLRIQLYIITTTVDFYFCPSL